MSRKTRTDFEGAVHHVYGRGNGKQVLFRDTADYRMFLGRMLHFQGEMGIKILAYCLMPNHYHLVTQTASIALSAFMHRLLTSYTRLFNDRWRVVGHLFQGRYGARRCKTDEEVRSAIRYVHLNPVEASLVGAPELWPWSGHKGLLDGADPFVPVKDVLALFDGKSGYLEYLARPLVKDSLPTLMELADLHWSPEEIVVFRGSLRTARAAELRRDFIVRALAYGHSRSAVAAFIDRTPSGISRLLQDLVKNQD